MTTNSSRELAAGIAAMLGMSKDLQEHFVRLIDAVEKDDTEWHAAVKAIQNEEPTFTGEHALLVRTFWMDQAN